MKIFLKKKGYGESIAVIDYKVKYTIRSIGKKQAIVDRIYKEGETRWRQRGTTYALTDASTIAQYREHRPGVPIPSYYIQNWSEVFSPAGEEGWDADENYTL